MRPKFDYFFLEQEWPRDRPEDVSGRGKGDIGRGQATQYNHRFHLLGVNGQGIKFSAQQEKKMVGIKRDPALPGWPIALKSLVDHKETRITRPPPLAHTLCWLGIKCPGHVESKRATELGGAQ